MAITSAQLNTALGSDGNKNAPKVVQTLPPYGAASQYWVIDGGVTYGDRQRKVVTTASNNAAQQAAVVVTALLAGGAP
jgi:hypothetical protein